MYKFPSPPDAENPENRRRLLTSLPSVLTWLLHISLNFRKKILILFKYFHYFYICKCIYNNHQSCFMKYFMSCLS